MPARMATFTNKMYDLYQQNLEAGGDEKLKINFMWPDCGGACAVNPRDCTVMVIHMDNDSAVIIIGYCDRLR